MPTVTKTSATNWLTWSAATGATVDGLVESAASPTSAFTYSNTLTLASLKIDPAYSPASLSATAASFATVLTSNSVLPFGYSLYLAANKTFTVTLQVAFSGASTTSHSVFVDTGAQLNANTSAVSGTANVSKYGSGTWRLAATENSSTSSASTPSSLTIFEGTCLTGSGTGNALGTGNITFSGGKLTVGVSRTFANAILMSGNGTLRSEGTAVATMTAGASSAGTLTIERSGSGSITFNPSLTISCPVSISSGGLLTIGASTGMSGALSGSGTLTCQGVWTNTLSGDATSFTGSVAGNFGLSGVNKTFGGNIVNACDFAAGSSWSFTGTSSGNMNALNNTTAKVYAPFNGTGKTYLINTGSPRLELYGPTGTISGPLDLGIASAWTCPNGTVTLNTGASLASAITEVASTDVLTLSGEDTSTCTYSGTISASTSPNPLLMRTKGTLVFSGAQTGGSIGRNIALNSTAAYAGTIKVTGSGFTGTSPLTLTYGTLDLTAGSPSLGGGLTAAANAIVKLPVSSTSTIRRINGNMTLAANSTLKFAA